jgi:hypothetical protein
MESIAQKNTILSREDRASLLKECLSGQLLPFENATWAINDLLGFLSEGSGGTDCAPPSLVIHLPPSAIANISSAEISKVYLSTVQSPDDLTALADIEVPRSLLGHRWRQRTTSAPLPWRRTEPILWKDFQVPVSRSILPNGLRVGLADTTLVRDGKTILRLSIPLATNGSSSSSSSSEALLALTAKTIAEGGAMGSYCTDQIEQWCLDHNIGVLVTHDGVDQLIVQLETPATELHSPQQKLHSLLQVRPFLPPSPFLSSDGPHALAADGLSPLGGASARGE